MRFSKPIFLLGISLVFTSCVPRDRVQPIAKGSGLFSLSCTNDKHSHQERDYVVGVLCSGRDNEGVSVAFLGDNSTNKCIEISDSKIQIPICRDNLNGRVAVFEKVFDPKKLVRFRVFDN